MNTNLITEEQYRDRNRERGIAYVVLLIYLTIMTCLGLSFIHRVGIEAKIVMNKTISSQAHSLAESAANHAMWGLLNVPGFAPDDNMYYMHSFANGRYGYKVRKPTETTFATIATVGVMGESVVDQGYVPYILPSNVFTAYGSSTNVLPLYRRMLGADWTDPGDVLIGGTNTPLWWVEIEGCPIRKELVGAAIDDISEIKAAVYDGTTWGNAKPMGHGNKNYKCFDIAYESQSGDALVVAVDAVGQPPKYNIWDGTAWVFANNQVAFSLPSGNLHDLVMASQPGGNEILIAVVTSNSEIQLVRWNGSAFSDLGTIETAPAHNGFGVVKIVYEHQSGDAMVVWSRSGDSALKFRMWNGVVLGPEGSLPDFGRIGYVIQGAADPDPTADYIIIGSLDNFFDINVAIWDGDNWIDSREVETSAPDYHFQCFDIAWEASGEDVLIVYSTYGQTKLSFLPWKKGTLLADSTEQVGPNLVSKPAKVRLLPIAGTEKIVCLAVSEWDGLHYSLWSGNKFRGDPGIVLEPSIPFPWSNRLVYDLAEANVPRTGGTGSGGGGNLPPTVEAGPDQTIYLPGDATLDGTVTDDGLPDPPATVTTTWSKQSGPGTVTFGDASLVDTTATFSETGTYVLRLTADDSDLNTFDEVTIIVKSCPLLYVVRDSLTLQDQESQRKTIMESWGFTVTLIDNDDTQANFDQAVLENDVVYISYSIQPIALGTKLDNPSIGVVEEHMDYYDESGFAERGWTVNSQSAITINDNTHYITSGFPMGDLTIVSSSESFSSLDVSFAIAPDLGLLAEASGSSPDITLSVLETGAQCWDGVTAQGRRVQLPWDAGAFDIALLNTDGLTIMKRAIEWAAHWEGGCVGTAICNGLVGYWELDETSGSTVASDSSGNGNNGTLTNMDPATDWVPGHIEGALDFDGINDYINVPHDENLALTGGMTFTAWGNTRNTSGGYKAILAKDFPGNGLSNYWFGISNDELVFGFFAAGGFQVVTTPSSNLQPGTWYHLAATFDPANDVVRLYVDGSEVHVGPFTYEPTTETVDLLIGTSVDGEDWDGKLDDIRIYNRVLNPGEITQLHALTEGVCGSGGGGGSDTDPPTPDPMTWASPPAPAGSISITMTASTATDPSGVEYYFECTAGGGNDSGWQDSPTYVDSGLTPVTSYTYRVKARDKSSNQNETGWSSEESATTNSDPEMYVNDIAMGFRKAGQDYYGQATVWIKDDGGADVSGALVTGDWSGDVSGMAMGTTGGDGKIFFESPKKKFGGTFTFTVTDVTKSGYVYNPALNVMTSGSITAP